MQIHPLSSLLTTPTARSVVALVVGLSLPRLVQRRDSTSVYVSSLLLTDASLPHGLTLEIWSRQSFLVIPLRPLDVVRISRVYARNGRLKLTGDATISRECGDGKRDVTDWAVKSRLYDHLYSAQTVREDKCIVGRGRKRKLQRAYDEYEPVEGNVKEGDLQNWTNVTVNNIFVNARRTERSQLKYARSLVDTQCNHCKAFIVKAAQHYYCKCATAKWTLQHVKLRCDIVWKPCVVVLSTSVAQNIPALLEGDALQRTLFYRQPHEILQDERVANEVEHVLTCLQHDKLHVVVQKIGNSAKIRGIKWKIIHIIV